MTIGNATALVTNTVPSARGILKPILTLVMSFDDLFPYMFHERNYGSKFESLFTTIH